MTWREVTTTAADCTSWRGLVHGLILLEEEQNRSHQSVCQLAKPPSLLISISTFLFQEALDWPLILLLCGLQLRRLALLCQHIASLKRPTHLYFLLVLYLPMGSSMVLEMISTIFLNYPECLSILSKRNCSSTLQVLFFFYLWVFKGGSTYSSGLLLFLGCQPFFPVSLHSEIFGHSHHFLGVWMGFHLHKNRKVHMYLLIAKSKGSGNGWLHTRIFITVCFRQDRKHDEKSLHLR